MQKKFSELEKKLEGPLYFEQTPLHQAYLRIYATDASVYQEQPVAVALPKTKDDIRKLILFASENRVTLIPRAAGTSLAGQVVGNGIVVDISCYFTHILEVNKEEKWVRVQPGVIRDDLNHYLRQYGLMFGPETSTASRAMIGGMVGNNSCGLHSIVWGATRDHIREIKVLLSDGSEAVFKEENIRAEQDGSFKSKIYRELDKLLSDPHNQQLLHDNFPSAAVQRRNTGYALDCLLHLQPYQSGGPLFNLCRLLAGSEGTLAIATEITLNLMELPPAETALVCVHCNSIVEAMHANKLSLLHQPVAGELVDKLILDFTSGHPEYNKNRFFIEGDPEAILMVEFMEHTAQEAQKKANTLVSDLRKNKLGFAWPVLYNEKAKFAWEVRKAGLGLLRNIKGDAQPVNLIEDCAVATDDLPAYVSDIQQLLKRHQVQASYYAHAAAGELHIEPILNLKSAEGVKKFRVILAETAELVKKYKGSLSGEHGDGRLRGEYIASVAGAETYHLFEQVKNIFDPLRVFNAGKIVATPPMDTNLRASQSPVLRHIATTFNFSESGGILRLAEKCSGSGDCRKMPPSGGVMCPSYMVTRNEKDTTRARANILRQFLSHESDMQPFNHQEIKEVMDLCLSCKGCKTECPSSVDVAKMKAEFLQHYYDQNGIPFRAKLVAGFSRQMKWLSKISWAYNWFYRVPAFRKTANRMIGFHTNRTMPEISGQTLRRWYRKNNTTAGAASNGVVYFFCDEFTNYTDAEIGRKAILLLQKAGYHVLIPPHLESGRSYLSKGLLRQAKKIANKNIELLSGLIGPNTPLVGTEPSAILSFRDEYKDLALQKNAENAQKLSASCFTIEEFLSREFGAGRIDRNLFTREEKTILIHGHCFQKALSSLQSIRTCLEIPVNYKTKLIPSGCCGMAGSFGYEKEHYDIAQKLGELVLFPAVRSADQKDLIAAPGTSCRHQILDGTGRKALHPAAILYDAIIS